MAAQSKPGSVAVIACGAIARELVERHTGPLNEEAITEASSRNGNFVSLTFTIIAMSKDQLDDIYRDATAHDDVLMAL